MCYRRTFSVVFNFLLNVSQIGRKKLNTTAFFSSVGSTTLLASCCASVSLPFPSRHHLLYEFMFPFPHEGQTLSPPGPPQFPMCPNSRVPHRTPFSAPVLLLGPRHRDLLLVLGSELEVMCSSLSRVSLRNLVMNPFTSTRAVPRQYSCTGGSTTLHG